MQLSRLVAAAGVLALVACADNTTPTAPSAPVFGRDAIAFGRDAEEFPMEIMELNPYATLQGVPLTAASITGIDYFGGPVLQVTKVAAVYWSKTKIYVGGPAPGSKGVGTADGSLVGHFLRNLGGSPYFNISTTYYDTVGGGAQRPVTNSVTYTQYWANNTSVPAVTAKVTNAQIKNMLVSGFNTGKLTYDPATVYSVFTTGKTNLGGGFGTQYCAYHSKFVWNGKTVLFSAQPYVQAFPNACSTGTPSPNGDLPADRVINVLAHEIEESTSDPRLNAWFDQNGEEDADKCAWTFGTTYTTGNGGVANMNLGGKDFLIQQNWVNAGTGGCLVHYP
jgi:Phosphate-induced protein 1 conserved region